ncbi:sce7726 family protein [Ancylobacter koreensis]|uniref:sce7726 family protein n=1 Tax=Ancylobacter koreensis TaxID=266121 RepID=UPI003CCFE052
MRPRLKDEDLRAAALRRLLAGAQKCAETLVLEELGLTHGASRVDIAVINGHIRGVEIKAEADSLERLPRQVQAYGLVVDRATLIASERHLPAALELLPSWWGVVSARRAANGSVVFRRLRNERANRETDAISLAQLMWRDEVHAVLSGMGCAPQLLRAPRASLYAELARRLPKPQLAALVRATLKSRTNWRDRPRPS